MQFVDNNEGEIQRYKVGDQIKYQDITFLVYFNNRPQCYNQNYIIKFDSNYTVQELIDIDFNFQLNGQRSNYEKFDGEFSQFYTTSKYLMKIDDYVGIDQDTLIYVSNVYDELVEFKENSIRIITKIPSFSQKDRRYNKTCVVGDDLYCSNGTKLFRVTLSRMYFVQYDDPKQTCFHEICTFPTYQLRLFNINNKLLIRDTQNASMYQLNQKNQPEQILQQSYLLIKHFNMFFFNQHIAIGYLWERNSEPNCFFIIYQDDQYNFVLKQIDKIATSDYLVCELNHQIYDWMPTHINEITNLNYVDFVNQNQKKLLKIKQEAIILKNKYKIIENIYNISTDANLLIENYHTLVQDFDFFNIYFDMISNLIDFNEDLLVQILPKYNQLFLIDLAMHINDTKMLSTIFKMQVPITTNLSIQHVTDLIKISDQHNETFNIFQYKNNIKINNDLQYAKGLSIQNLWQYIQEQDYEMVEKINLIITIPRQLIEYDIIKISQLDNEDSASADSTKYASIGDIIDKNIFINIIKDTKYQNYYIILIQLAIHSNNLQYIQILAPLLREIQINQQAQLYVDNLTIYQYAILKAKQNSLPEILQILIDFKGQLSFEQNTDLMFSLKQKKYSAALNLLPQAGVYNKNGGFALQSFLQNFYPNQDLIQQDGDVYKIFRLLFEKEYHMRAKNEDTSLMLLIRTKISCKYIIFVINQYPSLVNKVNSSDQFASLLYMRIYDSVLLSLFEKEKRLLFYKPREKLLNFRIDLVDDFFNISLKFKFIPYLPGQQQIQNIEKDFFMKSNCMLSKLCSSMSYVYLNEHQCDDYQIEKCQDIFGRTSKQFTKLGKMVNQTYKDYQQYQINFVYQEEFAFNIGFVHD